MIIKKTQVGEKKKKSGDIEPVYEQKLNVEFWQNQTEPCNVVIDEAHTIMNSRRSMSKINVIVSDWLALIRRVLGSASSGYGELTLISQLHNRIDLIAREMATRVLWHKCHYIKTCSSKKCSYSWREDSDIPEPMWTCPYCGSYNVKKHSHIIEVWHFGNMDLFTQWKDWGANTFHKHYFIRDIENYFKNYNTLQWENLFESFY